MECLWGLRESVYVKNPCRVLVLVFSTEQIFLQFLLTSLHSSPDFVVLFKGDRGTQFFLKCSKCQPRKHTVLLTDPSSPASPWKLRSAHPSPPPHAGPLGSWWMLFQWLVDCRLYSHPQDNLSLEGEERCTSEEQQLPMGTCGFLAWAIYKPAPKV